MQRTALFHGTKPVATAMLAPCSPHSVLQHRHLPSQRLAGPFHLHAQSCPSGSWPGIGGQRLPAAHSTTDDACLGALLELSVSDHPLYGQALALARQNRWGAARRVFEQFLRECPHCCKAWVSYAQVGACILHEKACNYGVPV